METGERGKDNWAHARWCNPCDQYHGVLYVCEKYPKKLKEKLKKLGDEYRRNPKTVKHTSNFPGGTVTQIYADVQG